MYSPMQSLSSFAPGLGVVSSLALTVSASPPPISNGPKTRSLVSRQAPGVVATSDFLRRGGHACRFTTCLALGLQTDLLRSGCCWGLGVYRWGRFLIYERWDIQLSILYVPIRPFSLVELFSDYVYKPRQSFLLVFRKRGRTPPSRSIRPSNRKDSQT